MKQFLTDRTNHVEKLRSQSNNILNVFTQTINGLQSVNNDVDQHVQAKTDQKTKLEQELADLNDIKVSNTQTIEKLSKIFS